MFRAIGARNSIIISAGIMALYGVCIGLFPSIWVLYVMFALAGIVGSIGLILPASDILVQEYGEDASKYVSYCVGGLMLGYGVGQGGAGIIYDNLGMRPVFLVYVVIAAVCAAVCAFTIKGGAPVAATTAEADDQRPQATQGSGGRSIFANPAAWLFWLITAATAGIVLPVLNYGTLYFPEHGTLSIAATDTIISTLGISNGAYNIFVNARVMEKLGPKTTAIIIFAACAGISAFAILYAGIPAMWVLVLMVVCYAVGATSVNLHAVLAPVIFGVDDSTEAMTKASSFSGLGNIVFPTVFASIATARGVGILFPIAVGISVVCLVGYLVLFAMSAKKAE